MFIRLSGSLGVAALMLGTPIAARGQEATASPFRAGQYGANIAINGLTFSSVDLLKFTSPTRAWVLSASASGSSQHTTGGIGGATTDNGQGLTLSLQRRFLRPAHPHVVLYLSPGIQGGFTHDCFTNGLAPGSVCNKIWQAGVVAEAGAEYVVNAHLGIGARYRASLLYNRFDFGASHLWSVDASIGQFGAFGALLF